MTGEQVRDGRTEGWEDNGWMGRVEDGWREDGWMEKEGWSKDGWMDGERMDEWRTGRGWREDGWSDGRTSRLSLAEIKRPPLNTERKNQPPRFLPRFPPGLWASERWREPLEGEGEGGAAW